MRVTIKPRAAFREFLDTSRRWMVLVAHRRAGKTVAVIQKLIKSALTHKRKGPPLRYAYIAPTRDQAKDIAWAYLKNYCGRLPGVEINESELRITFGNKAQIRLYSGENYERMRGLYFDGVVSDEDADMPPDAFTYVILPCLLDYEGWHTRIGTPKGKNAFYRAFARASDPRNSETHYALFLPASKSGILSQSSLDAIRDEIGATAYAQEMECDFNVSRPGAIYAAKLEEARQAGRITSIPISQEHLVDTTWDLGAPENHVVYYWQRVGFQKRLIDADVGLRNDDGTPLTAGQRVAHMHRKGYNYGTHALPHDAEREGYDALSYRQRLEKAQLQGRIEVIPREPHNAENKRIDNMVDIFGELFFNSDTLCEPSGEFIEGGALDGLDNYHRKEDKKGGHIMNVIVHDWANHHGNAFGYFGEALKKGVLRENMAVSRQSATRTVHVGSKRRVSRRVRR